MNWLSDNAHIIGAMSELATALFTFVIMYFAWKNLRGFLSEIKRNTDARIDNNKVRKAELIHKINTTLEQYHDLRLWILEEPSADKDTLNKQVMEKFSRIRDYAIVFETIYAYIKADVITESEAYDAFGARFYEFFTTEHLKIALAKEQFRDMDTPLSEFRTIVTQRRAQIAGPQKPWMV